MKWVIYFRYFTCFWGIVAIPAVVCSEDQWIEVDGDNNTSAEQDVSVAAVTSRKKGLDRVARLSEFPRQTPSSDPRFETHNHTVVEAQVGATAILHCKTSSSTGGLVSWIRKRDYQLLTVGLQSHSSDERFTINYVHWDWQLHVRYVQPRDAGAYECQVSSHPPASLFIHLDVVEAEAEILGSPEKHVKAGSILRLVCILHHTTEAPAYVFWYRGLDMINYNEEQSVVVESDEHTSVLLVAKATRRHSGNYTCVPSNAKPASILVHILTGEYPAAMQHGESSSKQSNLHSLFCLLSVLISWFYSSLLLEPPPCRMGSSEKLPGKISLSRRSRQMELCSQGSEDTFSELHSCAPKLDETICHSAQLVSGQHLPLKHLRPSTSSIFSYTDSINQR